MSGPRIIPSGSKFWDASGPQALKSPADIQKAYESGWCGAYREPEEHEALLAENKALTGFSSIDDAASSNGWAESGAGKLSLPFIHVAELFPGCMPGPAQQRGDCVSHSCKNAGLGSMCCEVVSGKPDEVTGKVEGLPDVSAEGVTQGVFSTEAIYWWRGHNGDGWYCSAAARVMQKSSGLWVRKVYPTLGLDLTKYSKSLAGKWGSRPPTGEIAEQGTMNLVRAFAESKSREARRDAIANGYFGNTCGMEGFSNSRDENGVSSRKGQWAHAMATIGYDDRSIVKQKYGDSLELTLNSWGVWNTGSRDIIDSAQYVPAGKKDAWIRLDIVNPSTGNIMIPKGAFWARSRDVTQREWLATSSVNGWPKRNLENYGGSLAG